jgi:hypothetical protein
MMKVEDKKKKYFEERVCKRAQLITKLSSLRRKFDEIQVKKNTPPPQLRITRKRIASSSFHAPARLPKAPGADHAMPKAPGADQEKEASQELEMEMLSCAKELLPLMPKVDCREEVKGKTFETTDDWLSTSELAEFTVDHLHPDPCMLADCGAIFSQDLKLFPRTKEVFQKASSENETLLYPRVKRAEFEASFGNFEKVLELLHEVFPPLPSSSSEEVFCFQNINRKLNFIEMEALKLKAQAFLMLGKFQEAHREVSLIVRNNHPDSQTLGLLKDIKAWISIST